MLNPQTQVRWVKRHSRITRVTHWTWAVCLFFLLLSGLQIFNAHPVLYIGDQSGFEFDNVVLQIGAEGDRGFVDLLGRKLDTTGVLGISDAGARAFPAWATVPSQTDLGTGRVIHFFFAWLFVVTLSVWMLGAIISGHLWRDLVLRPQDWRNMTKDVIDHLKLRFHHAASYGSLQRLSYGAVLFGLFPLVIATGLAMSPGMNAAIPWLADILGGRQTARSLHFLAATGLVLFFVVHILMVVLAGPVRELRAMVTGWVLVDMHKGSRDD